MSPSFSEMWEPNYIAVLEDTHPSSTLLELVLDVRYIASFRKWRASKSKIRPNFDIFDPPDVKAREKRDVGEVSESERSSMIDLTVEVLVPISSSVLKQQSIKGDWCRKSSHNFAVFDPCKI